MLSPKLIHMVEEHSEPLADAVVNRLRTGAGRPRIARLPESELRAQCLEILRNLGDWLANPNERQVADHFQRIGRLRREEEIPLHESIQALLLLKGQMLSHVRGQGVMQSSVDVYAEEEFEHHAGRFFDTVMYNVIRGYEGEGMPRRGIAV